MLTYTPGETFAHRLDPRSKLVFQAGFGVAAFARIDPAWLAITTLGALVVLAVARLSPLAVLRRLWFVLVFLAFAPLVAGVTLDPGFDPGPAMASALSLGRIVPILFVSAAYVHTTPVRDSRATVQRALPGRPGQLLGVGVGLTFRFFPVLLQDLRSARAAVRARGGDRLSTVARARRIAVVGLTRAVERADRLSVALRARCFAYNPTLPELRFSRRDYPVLVIAVGLAVAPLVF
jgi:biotin transport system permease protein